MKKRRMHDPTIKSRMHPIFSGIAEKLKCLKGSHGSNLTVWQKEFSIPVPFVVERRVVLWNVPMERNPTQPFFTSVLER